MYLTVAYDHNLKFMKIVSSMLKVFGYILFLLIVVVIAMEVILRVYDPFGFRQRDNEIILPRNRKMIFNNDKIPGLDKSIIHTKNSLGFRGPELPKDFRNYTSMIAVGGSTTECFYLRDSMCWTNLLSKHLEKRIKNVWINNAGYQGHSTYGNFILINNYIKYLKPRYVLIMEGINEINRSDIQKDESLEVKSVRTTKWGWLKRNSHVVNAILNIKRYIMADRLGVTDGYFNPSEMKHLDLSNSSIDSALIKQLPLVNAYTQRLKRIVDTCLTNNIQPILITQPMLYGEGKDCQTQVNLATVKISEGYNGLMMWRILEQYNNSTRAIAKDKSIYLVDLALKMPRCSKYFYDICHFTNEGSVKVSEILNENLETYLQSRN